MLTPLLWLYYICGVFSCQEVRHGVKSQANEQHVQGKANNDLYMYIYHLFFLLIFLYDEC